MKEIEKGSTIDERDVALPGRRVANNMQYVTRKPYVLRREEEVCWHKL